MHHYAVLWYAECHVFYCYDECRDSDCRYADFRRDASEAVSFRLLLAFRGNLCPEQCDQIVEDTNLAKF